MRERGEDRLVEFWQSQRGSFNWVPEKQSGWIFWCRDVALELICLWCWLFVKIDVWDGPW